MTLVWSKDMQTVKKPVPSYFTCNAGGTTDFNTDFQTLHFHIKDSFNKEIEVPGREILASFKNIRSWTSF